MKKSLSPCERVALVCIQAKKILTMKSEATVVLWTVATVGCVVNDQMIANA